MNPEVEFHFHHHDVAKMSISTFPPIKVLLFHLLVRSFNKNFIKYRVKTSAKRANSKRKQLTYLSSAHRTHKSVTRYSDCVTRDQHALFEISTEKIAEASSSRFGGGGGGGYATNPNPV